METTQSTYFLAGVPGSPVWSTKFIWSVFCGLPRDFLQLQVGNYNNVSKMLCLRAEDTLRACAVSTGLWLTECKTAEASLAQWAL